MSFIFTFSTNAVSIFLNGAPETVDSTHPKWQEIFDMVTGKTSGTEADLRALIDTRTMIVEAVAAANAGGDVQVGYDAVLYKGRAVHNHLTSRMLELVRMGIDITPWKNFMEKLYQNPSRTAVEELYLWLEKGNMPITENGNFLAYKKVKDDYTSYHRNADGTECRNDLGTIVEMPRNQVDDRRERTCSYGLHFCSFHYLPSYYGNEGRVLVLEINPADVVSIPSDYDNAKGRAHRYLVRGEVDEDKVEFAFSGTPVVAQSEYDFAWAADEVEDEDDGLAYDDDLEAHYDPETDEVVFSELNFENFTIYSVPERMDDGGFRADFENHYGNSIRVHLDANMTPVKAFRN